MAVPLPIPLIYISTDDETTAPAEPYNPLSGKVCVCFGDSITGNMDVPDDYPSFLGQLTGMMVINAGFGGCRMSDTHSAESYAAFSMVRLAEAVVSGDWTLQEQNVDDLSSVCHGYEHLSALQSVDWENTDYIIIAYGTNDIWGKVDIDDSTNPYNTHTYLGAMRYAIDAITTAYPHIEVLVLSPIYRYFNDEGIDSDSMLFNGHAFTEWGDALLEAAKERGAYTLDMYRLSGLNAETRSTYYSDNDGTHPNALGLQQFAQVVADYFHELVVS